MRILYSFVIQTYGMFIFIASYINSKAEKWITGRKNILNRISDEIKVHEDKIKVWFHVSSLGEFEQGRTVIEKYKLHYPDHIIILTFFSPSGYEVRKKYEYADMVYYLPLDTRKNARAFLEIIKPSLAFFVKYDYWFNYLNELKKRKIPVYIFSAIFRPDQLFFKHYGKWFLHHLNGFEMLFVQNEQSKKILNSYGITSVCIAGDTRFDRVAEIALKSKVFPLIEAFKADRKLVLLGSSWPPDEEMIQKFVQKYSPRTHCFVIAPHDISPQHIDSITKLFDSSVLYSEASVEKVRDKKVVIVNSIGILSSLYQYAEVAFIGGGFGKGIHNILEALTFGVPVVFGPKYNKFQEAKDILQLGGGYAISSDKELAIQLNTLLNDTIQYYKCKLICEKYIDDKKGATSIIMNYLIQKDNHHAN